MRPDPELSHISSSSASSFKPEFRQACATASRCGQCRGSCGNAGFHRDDAGPAGSPAAGPADLSGQRTHAAAIALPLPFPASAQRLSWLGQRPWIWFWVSFLVLIAAWTSFIVLAVKHQPEAISIKASTTRGHD